MNNGRLPSLIIFSVIVFDYESSKGTSMADQILKDNKGHIIGKITTSPSGMQTIKDVKGHTKGTYDPKTNTTKDTKGLKVGSGNLLITLL
jgi:hypothetical protein